MKKKILSLLLVLGLFLSGTILFTACGEPKIRNIYTKLDGDSLTSRNLGGFGYTTSEIQPALQELDKMTIVIEYTDDSKVEVALNDSKVQRTIQYEGNNIESFPNILQTGNYSVKYAYDNSSTYAQVDFFIEAGVNEGYQIISDKNTWAYLDMPMLSFITEVSGYNGASSVVDFYYIDIQTYQQTLREDPDAFTTPFYVPEVLSGNRIDGISTETKIPAGTWYLFAYVPFTDNYNASLTKPYQITVTKSILDSIVDDATYAEYSITAEYSFNGTIIDNIALNNVTPEIVGSIYACNSNYPDTWVSLELDGWANPNKTLNCNSADKQAAVRFAFASEQDANNYELTGDAYEQTINVELQKGQMEYPSFAFYEGDEEIKTGTVTKQKKDFEGYKLIDGLYQEDFTDFTYYYDNYFNVVEFYDVTDEEDEKKINIYFEDGDVYKDNNYSGPIKIVLKVDEGQYVPTVEIVDNVIGTYKIELRIKDKVNYEWGFLEYNYGTDNLTLTINITKNSVNDAMVVQGNYVSVDKDGYGEITALVPKEYFENIPTSEDITLISHPYEGAESNVTITDPSITTNDNGDNNYKIVIKNKYQFGETTTGSYSLCYKLKITTSDDYENIEQQNQLEVLQFVINPGTDYSGVSFIPKYINHYATINEDEINKDSQNATINIAETPNVKSLFGNLTSEYGTWKIQYEKSSGSYQDLADNVALTSGNTLKIKLLYEINSELEELNTQFSHIAVGVSEINFTLTAQ